MRYLNRKEAEALRRLQPRMNRKWFGLILLLLAFLVPVSMAGSETSSRKLTLMVYMCGSNLESSYGSASADIREMMDSGAGGQDVSLLVMTGGSDSWHNGYSADQLTVSEIRGGRQRVAWTGEKRSMGEQQTLETFLAYGVENYPADAYALILWNHGGGPMEGVCWDELFSLDHLSLQELTGALKNTGIHLSWIGFDACLMSSLEVANALAPYADYMIASQETEPASGWNYSFLTGIAEDPSPEDTGKRIVDSYFEGQEEAGERLTLALTDLKKAAEAAEGLSWIFAPLNKLTLGQFVYMSGIRTATMNFGSPVRALGDTGSDLVDARDLLSRVSSGSVAGIRALKYLDDAVIYSRSNSDNASGLTMYHPAENKGKYLSAWREAYRKTGFNPDYIAYTEAFGSILTGDEILHWENLITSYGPENTPELPQFTLHLTDEQAQSIVSAQLLIIQDSANNLRLNDGCVLLSSQNVPVGGNDLTAFYDGTTLYAEKDDGKLIGPVSYMQSEDGASHLVRTAYLPVGKYYMQNLQHAIYVLENIEGKEYPQVRQIRLYDEVTGTYTSRLGLNENNYWTLYFWNVHRYFPGIGPDSVLPAFESWGANDNRIKAKGMDLKSRWHFRTVKEMPDDCQMYAMFQITDVQQNSWCSVPIPIRNANLTSVSAVPEETETSMFSPELNMMINRAPGNNNLQMEFAFTNPSDQEITVHADGLLINGSNWVAKPIYLTIGPGMKAYELLTFEGMHLFGIDALRSLSFDLSWEAAEDPDNGGTIPVRFMLEETDVSDLYGHEILGDAEEDGMRLQVLDIAPDKQGQYLITFAVDNNTEHALDMYDVLLNRIQSQTYGTGRVLQPHVRQVYTAEYQNSVSASFARFRNSNATADMYDTILSDNILQSAGEDAIRDITFVFRDQSTSPFRYPKITVPLYAPLPLGECNEWEEDHWYQYILPPMDFITPADPPLLAENNQYRVSLNSMYIVDRSLVLSLKLENRVAYDLDFMMSRAIVNGADTYMDLKTDQLIQGAKSYTYAVIDLPEDAASIPEFALCFRSYDQKETNPVTIRLSSPVTLPANAGHWIPADAAVIDSAIQPDVLLGEGEVRLIEENVILPENAAAYQVRLMPEMAESQRADFQSGSCALVRENELGYLQCIYLQKLYQDDSGLIYADCPGLITTLQQDPELLLFTSRYAAEAGRTRGALAFPLEYISYHLQPRMISNIVWELNYETNTATITEMEIDNMPSDWRDLAYVSAVTYELIPAYAADGSLLHFDDLVMRDDFEWYLNKPSAALNYHPAQLILRPVTAEDHLQILYSITRKDGTRYSLPLVPYPAGKP